MGGIQDQEVAELCGAIVGDGWIQSNQKGIFITGDPLEDKDYYDDHISKIVSENFCPVVPKDFPYWGVYGISIYSRKIISKFVGLDLPLGTKGDSVSIPKWISEGDKKLMNSFVRGFFDTDGGIFCQKDYTAYAKEFDKKFHTKIRLRMSSISGKLIKEIFNFMINSGYRVVLRVRKGGFRNKRNNKDGHILEINAKKDISRFFEELKPSNFRHMSKYLIWKKFGFCPPNTKINQRKDILKKRLDPYSLY